MNAKSSWNDYLTLNPLRNWLFKRPDIVASEIDAAEVDASQAGLSQESLDKILAALEALYASGEHPGVAASIRYKGHLLVNRAWGYAEKHEGENLGRKLTLDTPICLFSSSKAITAMLVHKLAEDGLVDLLNPVATYLPEFGANGKEKITLYQLLAHKAGVPNVVKEGVPGDVLMDPDAVYELICQAEPLCPDGRITAYHAVTGGFVIAKLVEKMTGKSITEYLDEVIRKPLGMKYFTYGLDKKYRDKVALNYKSGFKNGKLVSSVLNNAFGVSIDEGVEMSNTEAFMDSVIPSANLYATAEETCRFFQMLLDDGQYQGKQVFDPLTIHKATQESGKALIDKNVFLPMRYSPGFMLGGKPMGIWGSDSHYAFGHVGFANILCWADPARDLSVGILTTGKPVLGKHVLALPRLMMALSSEIPPHKV